jgi:hypothetical protein
LKSEVTAIKKVFTVNTLTCRKATVVYFYVNTSCNLYVSRTAQGINFFLRPSTKGEQPVRLEVLESSPSPTAQTLWLYVTFWLYVWCAVNWFVDKTVLSIQTRSVCPSLGLQSVRMVTTRQGWRHTTLNISEHFTGIPMFCSRIASVCACII